ncbi:MAG: hypothetical protein IPP74_03820 [Alphaproteobacteria bacterium]|nr:hypothetical protein [Alphaproteobacteria bacterium]
MSKLIIKIAHSYNKNISELSFENVHTLININGNNKKYLNKLFIAINHEQQLNALVRLELNKLLIEEYKAYLSVSHFRNVLRQYANESHRESKYQNLFYLISNQNQQTIDEIFTESYHATDFEDINYVIYLTSGMDLPTLFLTHPLLKPSKKCLLDALSAPNLNFINFTYELIKNNYAFNCNDYHYLLSKKPHLSPTEQLDALFKTLTNPNQSNRRTDAYNKSPLIRDLTKVYGQDIFDNAIDLFPTNKKDKYVQKYASALLKSRLNGQSTNVSYLSGFMLCSIKWLPHLIRLNNHDDLNLLFKESQHSLKANAIDCLTRIESNQDLSYITKSFINKSFESFQTDLDNLDIGTFNKEDQHYGGTFYRLTSSFRQYSCCYNDFINNLIPLIPKIIEHYHLFLPAYLHDLNEVQEQEMNHYLKYINLMVACWDACYENKECDKPHYNADFTSLLNQYLRNEFKLNDYIEPASSLYLGVINHHFIPTKNARLAISTPVEPAVPPNQTEFPASLLQQITQFTFMNYSLRFTHEDERNDFVKQLDERYPKLIFSLPNSQQNFYLEFKNSEIGGLVYEQWLKLHEQLKECIQCHVPNILFRDDNSYSLQFQNKNKLDVFVNNLAQCLGLPRKAALTLFKATKAKENVETDLPIRLLITQDTPPLVLAVITAENDRRNETEMHLSYASRIRIPEKIGCNIKL